MDLLKTFLVGFGLFVSIVETPPQSAPQTPAALASDPKGWVDLLADKSLKSWTRVPLGPVGQLPAGKADALSPWKIDAASGALVCEGDKAGHEMLRHVTEFGDFILHAEFKFTKVEADAPYNSGVFVRASADGVTWFQAQTGPQGGYLFGTFAVNGTPTRMNLRDKMIENRMKPAGEWNTYEIKAVGRTLTLWVNGAVVNEYTECDVPRGNVGLEAEGYRIEFRNVKIKEMGK